MSPLRQAYTLIGIFFFLSCSSQPSSPYAPEPGSYSGYIYGVSATTTYGYNPITGFGVQPSTTTNLTPSVLGDMTISSKGNNSGTYSFAKADMKGEWKYDEKSNNLQCTGPLKDALTYYRASKGFYTMGVTFAAGDGKRVSYTYSKKASKPFPKLTEPNNGLTGSITIKPDYKSIAILDAASATVKTSFNANLASTNAAHYTIGVTYTDDPHNYEISIFDAQGKPRVISPADVRSYGWAFKDYKFAVLSNDQSRMALLGSVPDRYGPDFSYTPGYYAIGIFDNKGKQLGSLPMDRNFNKPWFLADGRLVYSPDKGGVAVANTDYSNSKTIYSNRVNCLGVSPDGKRVAVSSGLHFFTMNIDGSDVKQIICGGKPLEADKAENVNDMAWSPDGKYLVVSLKSIGSNIIVIVPLDGKPYFFLRDEEGDPYKHEGPAISWH
jgi:hypothetical protein